MSDALEHVRYSCGIAGEEVANYVDQLQAKVAELEAEVERLSAAHVKACQANADSQAELAKAEQRVAELEAENELLKGRKNVELAANTDNAKSKQQRELAGPMEMGQLLAGSTHKTSGDLEIERTKPVTWIHKGGGFISDSRGKFIGCFSGDFRYRERIICAINSESETSNQLAAEQLNNKLLREALEHCMADGDFDTDDARTSFKEGMKILAQPSDTSALDAYVAEKVKEKTDALHYRMEHCYSIDHVKIQCELDKITKQHDLAVEALDKISDPWISSVPAIAEFARKVSSAIKESDGK